MKTSNYSTEPPYDNSYNNGYSTVYSTTLKADAGRHVHNSIAESTRSIPH